MSFLREVQLEKEFGPSIVFREALGFLPNLIRAQSLLPRVIEAQAKLEDAVRLRAGDLSRAQKERILLTIAADRRDTYCIAMHSRVLSSLGATRGQIDDLLNEYRAAGLSAPDLATLQFCLKLSRNAPGIWTYGSGDIRDRRRDRPGYLPRHSVRGFAARAGFPSARAAFA